MARNRKSSHPLAPSAIRRVAVPTTDECALWKLSLATKGEPELAALTLDQLGLPPFDIFTARSLESEKEISYCLAGDAATVLGSLAITGGQA